MSPGQPTFAQLKPQNCRLYRSGAAEPRTGHPVRYDYKQPDQPDVLPPPDAVVVAPATFNTINKWAYGSSDTLALGLLNEAIGLDIPVIAVPTPSTALVKHPAFTESVARLRSWGVNVLLDPERYPLPEPNMGPPAAELFPWEALREEVATMLTRVAGRGRRNGGAALER